MTVQSATHTDRMASISAEEFVWDIAGHVDSHDMILPALMPLIESAAPRHILDLGSGNGSLAGLLSGKGYAVTGLEYSQSGIDIARKSFPQVRFEQHDLANRLDADHVGGYDFVISIEVIEHLLLPRKLMEAALQALRPGGLFVLTTPFHGYWKNLALALTGSFDKHWHPLRDFGHIKFFSRATMLELFREYGFTDVRFETLGRIPPLAKSMLVSGCRPP
jgi:2-polyprenyl-6-hydroxyphenyl methylase/3-demethylubiquinone-9 3-methyltransferase